MSITGKGLIINSAARMFANYKRIGIRAGNVVARTALGLKNSAVDLLSPRYPGDLIVNSKLPPIYGKFWRPSSMSSGSIYQQNLTMFRSLAKGMSQSFPNYARQTKAAPFIGLGRAASGSLSRSSRSMQAMVLNGMRGTARLLSNHSPFDR